MSFNAKEMLLRISPTKHGDKGIYIMNIVLTDTNPLPESSSYYFLLTVIEKQLISIDSSKNDT